MRFSMEQVNFDKVTFFIRILDVNKIKCRIEMQQIDESPV